MTKRKLRISAWLVGAASALVGGCDGLPSQRATGPSALSEQPLPVAVAQPERAHEGPAETAQKLFTTRCAVCHGSAGRGDGPAAAALTPNPRAFADAAWQKSATDDTIYKTIINGGPAMGKSAGMPPNPDLADKPELVKGLVTIVREFNKG